MDIGAKVCGRFRGRGQTQDWYSENLYPLHLTMKHYALTAGFPKDTLSQ